MIEALVSAHLEGFALARELMLAQELADVQEQRAYNAVALAAMDPDDQRAIEQAIESSALAELADEHEMQAAARWGEHVIRTHRLLLRAEALPWMASVASARGRPTESTSVAD